MICSYAFPCFCSLQPVKLKERVSALVGSGSNHRSWFVSRMPATATTEAHVQEDRDATLYVDCSLGPEGAFAFPAPHRNACSFNVGHVAVVFEWWHRSSSLTRLWSC